MALQTLNTIKQWFKTGLKPTQAQFWDTWDSFRHKFDKIPVKEVEGLDELLLSKADKTVLDHHLADKNAHAPQVNTDWNSESGFSQLINKPEFKTINGETIVGEGDITIGVGGDIPALQQVIDRNSQASWFQSSNNLNLFGSYGNFERQFRSFMSIVGESDTFSEINQLRTGITISNGAENNSSIGGPNKTTLRMFNGVFNLIYHAFNKTTNISFNIPNADIAQLKFPAPSSDGEYTLPLRINGQVADEYGDVTIPTGGGSQTLDQVLDAGNTATDKNLILVSTTSGSPSLKTLTITGGEIKMEKNFDPITSTEMGPDGVMVRDVDNLQRSALLPNGVSHAGQDSENNYVFTSMTKEGIYFQNSFGLTFLKRARAIGEGGGSSFDIVIPAKGGTLATTSDFKTINGESIVGDGNIIITNPTPTLSQVLEAGSYDGTGNQITLGYTPSGGKVGSNWSVNGINFRNEDLDVQTNVDSYEITISDKLLNYGVKLDKNYIGFKTRFEGNFRESSVIIQNHEYDYSTQGRVSVQMPLVSGILATTDDITLQKALDSGKTASFNSSEQTISIFDSTFPGASDDKSFIIASSSGTPTQQLGFLHVRQDLVQFSNSTNTTTSNYTIDKGKTTIAQSDSSTSSSTTLQFQDPLINSRTIIKIPAKPALPEGEYYTLATTEDLLPKITTSTTNLTIPSGSNVRMITLQYVDGGTPRTVTLPPISDAIGAIYYISATDGATIVSNSGGLDIWYQALPFSTFFIEPGAILQLINDGLNYKVVQLTPQ